MRVLIMGCGRVGSELSHALGDAGHEVTVIDKRAEAFDRYPPGEHARTIVGLGFDRDVLEEAGIREADAFIAVSSGDNSNIVSARVALEHYHVPKVIARIFDPRRAEIYERLNIPTVATTTWGVKQFQLMLLHTGKEVRESLGSRSRRRRSSAPAATSRRCRSPADPRPPALRIPSAPPVSSSGTSSSSSRPRSATPASRSALAANSMATSPPFMPSELPRPKTVSPSTRGTNCPADMAGTTS